MPSQPRLLRRREDPEQTARPDLRRIQPRRRQKAAQRRRRLRQLPRLPQIPRPRRRDRDGALAGEVGVAALAFALERRMAFSDGRTPGRPLREAQPPPPDRGTPPPPSSPRKNP